MSIILDGTTGVTFPNGVTMADGTSSPVTAAQGGTGLSSVGSAGNTLFTTDGSTWSSTAKIVRGTAVNSTSGTSITFSSIPSWVKRITVMFNGVSVSAGAHLLIQLGSGSASTTGYVTVSSWNTGSAINGNGSTTGFRFENAANTGANVWSGNYTFTNITGNIWTGTGIATTNVNSGLAYSGGVSPTLAGTLDRVVITTTSTDTFDAGQINILYE